MSHLMYCDFCNNSITLDDNFVVDKVFHYHEACWSRLSAKFPSIVTDPYVYKVVKLGVPNANTEALESSSKPESPIRA